MTPYKTPKRKKADKLDLINTNFCASKDTIKKQKSQLTEWEKIFANHTSDKSLVSRIYKELLQLNKRTNILIQK